jgi:alkyl sulfatase BDS1-like metallo-beta-lactamase superfamily hydrolase
MNQIQPFGKKSKHLGRFPVLEMLFVILGFLSLLTGCDSQLPFEEGANEQGHTGPTQVTVLSNQSVMGNRPFKNIADFDNARRGLIAKEDSLVIKNAKGETVWNMDDYQFINSEGAQSPASVNPSLYRQAALNNIHGLFKVTDGVYQIRGYDLANMSIIEGETGWIIVDPLTARETASRALLFAQKHLGKKPIKAILFTHSHIDHFGGVQGVLQHLSEEEKSGLRIIAPAGFEEEATSENIIAGTAMARRAMYMYGKRLARDERGHVGTGLGKGPAFGSFGITSVTETISKSGTEIAIDGVPFKFMMVSGSEAPAEFVFYLPTQKAFCGAELVSRNMHNLYTLRGAKVRDGKLWSEYIEEVRETFKDADVYFASHHWPLWGNQNIDSFLIQQRDTYKYIHDQSVRLMNLGFTPNEIADQITLPEALMTGFHNQGYYGTIKHNAKAVYQGYLGWFTANPSKLDPLPEAEAAERYVEMMGGVDNLLKQAEIQFEAAEKQEVAEGVKTYRWLAELLNHAVFAYPDNKVARSLLAKVYDQLGYMAESAPWRDFYLSGAYELRHGGPDKGIDPVVMKEVLHATPVHLFFDSMSVNLNPEKADGEVFNIKVRLSDLDENYLLSVSNSVLRHKPVSGDYQADATLEVTRRLFVEMILGQAGLKDTLFGDDLKVHGSKLDLIRFFSMFDKPKGTFNIVIP